MKDWGELVDKYQDNDYEYDLDEMTKNAKDQLIETGSLLDSAGRQYAYINKSAEQFRDDILKIPINTLHYNSSIRSDGDGWAGSKSFEEALDRFDNPRNYYKKEIDLAYAMAQDNIQVLSTAVKETDTLDFDLTGDYLDVSRHLDGLPDSFVRGDYKAMKQMPFVKLIVTHNHMSAGVSPERIATYASNVTTLVASLYFSKIPTSVTYVKSHECVFVTFPIKGYQEPLSIPYLFSILHPSFFRRLIFRAIENCPNDLFDSGYGYANTYVDVEDYNKNGDETAIVLMVDDDYNSMVKKISALLNKH